MQETARRRDAEEAQTRNDNIVGKQTELGPASPPGEGRNALPLAGWRAQARARVLIQPDQLCWAVYYGYEVLWRGSSGGRRGDVVGQGVPVLFRGREAEQDNFCVSPGRWLVAEGDSEVLLNLGGGS